MGKKGEGIVHFSLAKGIPISSFQFHETFGRGALTFWGGGCGESLSSDLARHCELGDPRACRPLIQSRLDWSGSVGGVFDIFSPHLSMPEKAEEAVLWSSHRGTTVDPQRSSICTW